MRITPPGGDKDDAGGSELTVRRTPTGYWTVQRGEIVLAGAMTRSSAERERDLLERLRLCSERRAGGEDSSSSSL
jgi:hypothetical protein